MGLVSWSASARSQAPLFRLALYARSGDREDEKAIVENARIVRLALDDANLHGLVNNADSSFPDTLLLQSVPDSRKQLDVNLVGLFAVPVLLQFCWA